MNVRVSFVSAGPGAADLITLRGVQRLSQAEVVLFDALTDPALRAFAPQATWVDVGKRGFDHAAKQSDINALLVRLVRDRTCCQTGWPVVARNATTSPDEKGATRVSPTTAGDEARMMRAGSLMPRYDQSCSPVAASKAKS